MPRVQFQTEFMFKASPSIIYLFITQPTGLVRWFCDKVDNVGDHYTFSWEGDSEEATLIVDIEDELIKFQWEERPEEVQGQIDVWEAYIKKFKAYCGG